MGRPGSESRRVRVRRPLPSAASPENRDRTSSSYYSGLLLALLSATGHWPTTSRLCYWLLYLLLAHYIPTLLLALLSATGPLHPDSATVPSICYWPHKTQYWLPSALCYCWLSWLHYSGSTPCSLLLAATQIIIEHEKDKI